MKSHTEGLVCFSIIHSSSVILLSEESSAGFGCDLPVATPSLPLAAYPGMSSQKEPQQQERLRQLEGRGRTDGREGGICWKGEAKSRMAKICHNQHRNKEKQVVKVVQKKELECEEGKLL